MKSETRRVAGQHVRAQARAKSWKRFFGGSLRREYENYDRGAKGEEAVGAILEGLVEDGWHVIHDVSFSHGNIDHIVVGPGGIFTVETKSRGGKVWLDNLEPKMLGQAYAEKKDLEKITGMEVQALLVFSRAYIVDKVPAWRSGVGIVPARMLHGFFARRRPVMSPKKAAELHRSLAFAARQAVS